MPSLLLTEGKANMEKRICTECGKEWMRGVRGGTGRSAKCGECMYKKRKEYNQQWLRDNPERKAVYNRGKLERLNEDCFNAYGKKCVCCGSTKALTLDHIYNDGDAHRKFIGADGTDWRWWLRANGFPDMVQVLCNTCNTMKGFIYRNVSLYFSPLKVVGGQRGGARAYYLANLHGERVTGMSTLNATNKKLIIIEFFKKNPEKLGVGLDNPHNCGRW